MRHFMISLLDTLQGVCLALAKAPRLCCVNTRKRVVAVVCSGHAGVTRALKKDVCWWQVECAINRATKEKRVAELEEALRNSSVAFGVRYNKVSVSSSVEGLHVCHSCWLC